MTDKDISSFLADLTQLSRKHGLHIAVDWPKIDHSLGGYVEELVTVKEGGESVYYMHLTDEKSVFLMSRERAQENIARLEEELEVRGPSGSTFHTALSKQSLKDEIARQKAYIDRMDEIDREIAVQPD